MASSRRFIARTCEKCGGEFEASEQNVARGWGRFCSHSCASNHDRPVGMSHSALRRRAREIWITRHEREPMCWCGVVPADVHHKDGDPTNNDDSNHEPLCRSHHVAHENALHPKRQRAAAVSGSPKPVTVGSTPTAGAKRVL